MRKSAAEMLGRAACGLGDVAEREAPLRGVVDLLAHPFQCPSHGFRAFPLETQERFVVRAKERVDQDFHEQAVALSGGGSGPVAVLVDVTHGMLEQADREWIGGLPHAWPPVDWGPSAGNFVYAKMKVEVPGGVGHVPPVCLRPAGASQNHPAFGNLKPFVINCIRNTTADDVDQFVIGQKARFQHLSGLVYHLPAVEVVQLQSRDRVYHMRRSYMFLLLGSIGMIRASHYYSRRMEENVWKRNRGYWTQ